MLFYTIIEILNYLSEESSLFDIFLLFEHFIKGDRQM